MVLSMSARNKKQRCLNPVAKTSEYIGKCQECNEKRRKTYVVAQIMLKCFVSLLNGLLATSSVSKLTMEWARSDVTVESPPRSHIGVSRCLQ